MKKFLFIFILVFILFPSCVFASNFTNYIVRDMDSGRTFLSLSPDEKKLPASTTKIMTCILGIENNNLSDVVTVKDEILTMSGSNIYLEVNEKILMQDLLYGMMLRSGNDAAIVVARYTSGDINDFVYLMNEKAKELGLYNTIFNNPTGLDDSEKNYSTVSDLSLLYIYAFKNKTFRTIVGTKKYQAESSSKSYLFNNRMKLLQMYDKATGGKTGYTPKAGRVLVSSASNNDLNLVIASIGDDYGYKKHIQFYEKIFSKYKNYELINKDKFNIKSNLGKLYINNSFSYPLSDDEYKNIRKQVLYNKNKKGHVGDILIYLNDDLIHKEKIYLKEKKTSFLEKIKSCLF